MAAFTSVLLLAPKRTCSPRRGSCLGPTVLLVGLGKTLCSHRDPLSSGTLGFGSTRRDLTAVPIHVAAAQDFAPASEDPRKTSLS